MHGPKISCLCVVFVNRLSQEQGSVTAASKLQAIENVKKDNARIKMDLELETRQAKLTNTGNTAQQIQRMTTQVRCASEDSWHPSQSRHSIPAQDAACRTRVTHFLPRGSSYTLHFGPIFTG